MLCYIMHVVYIGKFGDDTNVFIQPIFGRNAVQAWLGIIDMYLREKVLVHLKAFTKVTWKAYWTLWSYQGVWW